MADRRQRPTRRLIGLLVLALAVTACTVTPHTTARVLPVDDRPTVPSAAAVAHGDPLERQTIEELRSFVAWLDANEVPGFIGEVGWPNNADGDGDRWNRLAARWYSVADEAGLSVSAWAAGARWGAYPLAIYRAAGDGGRIGRAGHQAEVVEAHLGRPAMPRGIAAAGGSFGDEKPGFSNRRPGRHGRDYWYPSAGDLQYLSSRGFDFVRIDFRWERLQRRPYGPLNRSELSRLRTVARDAKAAGLKVVLDLHNYGAYRRARPDGRPRRATVGSTALPATALVDLWLRLSEVFNRDPTVLAYGLMNEPHGLKPRRDVTTTLALWNTSAGGWHGPVAHAQNRGRSGTGALRIALDADATSAFVHSARRKLRYCARAGPLLSVWIYLPATARPDGWTASLQLQDATYTYRPGPHQALVPGRWTQVRFSASSAVLGACRAVAIHVSGPPQDVATHLLVDDLQQRGRLLPAQVWETTSQAVVAALRERGDETDVLVAGHHWSKVQTWAAQHPQAWIEDPADATMYEAHHYWDAAEASYYRSYDYELSATRTDR